MAHAWLAKGVWSQGAGGGEKGLTVPEGGERVDKVL